MKYTNEFVKRMSQLNRLIENANINLTLFEKVMDKHLDTLLDLIRINFLKTACISTCMVFDASNKYELYSLPGLIKSNNSLSQLEDRINELRESKTLQQLKDIRDKMLAHPEKTCGHDFPGVTNIRKLLDSAREILNQSAKILAPKEDFLPMSGLEKERFLKQLDIILEVN